MKELEFKGAGNIQTTNLLELTDFRLIGNGVVNVELELDAVNVEVELNFVGNLILKGEVDRFHINNEGVGNINASKFRAKNLDLKSSGIGNLAVQCDDELSLIASGIRNVSFTDNPRLVHEDVSGIAKVTRN